MPVRRPGRLDRWLGDHHRGRTSVAAAVRSAAIEALDVRLARHRWLWIAYAITGRRPAIERVIVAATGPLTETSTEPAAAPCDEDGRLDLTNGAVVEAVCGPGWSFPELESGGTWTDGREARLSLPRPSDGPLTAELELHLLVRGGDAARRLEVRVDGRCSQVLWADEAWSLRRVSVDVGAAPRKTPVELSLLVTRPSRPADLGINRDRRRLGVLLRRARVRDARVTQPTPHTE